MTSSTIAGAHSLVDAGLIKLPARPLWGHVAGAYSSESRRRDASRRTTGFVRGWHPGNDCETRAGERGAISLIGLFMTVFLVGLLYYVVGVAEAVLAREELQDGADTAAMAAAIAQAQAMNFVVLLNVTMSVILAILIAIRMVQGIALFGVAVAAGLAWPTAGASLALIPPLRELYDAMKSVEDSVGPSARAAMEALHAAADGVAEFAPEASSNSGVATLAHASHSIHGIVSGASKTLPLEDAPYSVLCDHAADTVADFAMVPFERAGVSFGPIEEFVSVGSIVRGITGELAAWFCGEEGAAAPNRAEATTGSYPIMPLDEQCAASQSTSACDAAEAERRDAEPEEATGRCREGMDCSPSGPYESYARAARQQCNPAIRRVRATSYLLRTGTVDYVYTGDTWERRGPPQLTRTEYRVVGRRRRDQNPPPCGRRAELSAVLDNADGLPISEDFHVEPYPDGANGEFVPVCARAALPSMPIQGDPEVGEVRHADYEEVTHIFGCTERVEEAIDFSGTSQDSGQGDQRRPKQVLDGVGLGGERFQLWAIVEREHFGEDSRRLVRLPLWRRADGEGAVGRLRWLGRYGLAQAEFFYDAQEAGARDAWMWNMDWRARLRRFAWPEGDVARQQLEEAVQLVPLSRMGELEDVLIRLRRVVAH